jgi:hypothetical protein
VEVGIVLGPLAVLVLVIVGLSVVGGIAAVVVSYSRSRQQHQR